MRRRFGISAVCEDVMPPKWHQRLAMIQHATPPAALTASPIIPDAKKPSGLHHVEFPSSTELELSANNYACRPFDGSALWNVSILIPG
jgi:hypothetical protein